MRKELLEKLQFQFPWIPKFDPLYNKPVPMTFDCEDGWFNLIYNLCTDINIVIQREGLKAFFVDQVKEKFGGLRFSVSTANKEIFDLINAAERLSYATCEFCGKVGVLTVRHGFYQTLCSAHIEKYNAVKVEDDHL